MVEARVLCPKAQPNVPGPAQPSSSPAQEVVPVGILIVQVYLQVLPRDFIHYKLEGKTGDLVCRPQQLMKQTSHDPRGAGFQLCHLPVQSPGQVPAFQCLRRTPPVRRE